MWHLDDATALPPARAQDECAVGLSSAVVDPASENLDSRVFDYVCKAQPAFEKLRQSAAQIAGLLVLGAAGGRCDADHPMFALALEAYANGADMISGLVPPAKAVHHHHHIMRAVRALELAVAAAPAAVTLRDDLAIDAALLPLQTAYTELQHASRCLPGFEIVDFAQGCCAAHAGSGQSTREQQTSRNL